MNATLVYGWPDGNGRPLNLNMRVVPPTKKEWSNPNVPFRRSSRRITTSHSVAGPQVSGIFELITIVASLCDWPTLTQLSNCSTYLRSVCQQVMRSYILEFIGPYIGKDNLRRFFNILSTTKSIITGGVVHAMLCACSVLMYKHVRPIQLELVVPQGDGRALAVFSRFFFPLGFSRTFSGRTCDGYAHLSRRTMSFERGGDGLRISLVESSSNDVLPIVLSAGHTSGMDVLTASRLYCFYPNLLEKGENIVMSSRRHPFVFDREDGFWPFNFGLRSYMSTQEWTGQRRECGHQCPALWRATKNLPGVRFMRWGGIDSNLDNGQVVSGSDGFENTTFIWSMHGACKNIFCSNYKRGGVFYDLI